MRYPKFVTKCPDCGEKALWNEEFEYPSMHNDLCAPDPIFLGWVCEECGWEDEATEEELFAKPEPTKEQAEERNAIYNELWKLDNKKYETPDLDAMFEYAPEGDFEWEGEAGDWHVWCCGESDCPVQWHQSAHWMTIGRRDGKRYIEVGDVDSDGNSDFTDGWEDGENWEESGVAWDLARESDQYFKGWLEYYLHCAVSFDDPVGNWFKGPEEYTPEEWVADCLKHARDNLNYLKK